MNQPSPRVAWLAVLTLLPLALAGCRSTDSPEAREEVELSPADSLLRRSVKFHDPDGLWSREAVGFVWTSRRPDGAVGFRFEGAFGPGGDLRMSGERRGRTLDYQVTEDVMTARVDGQEEVDEELLGEVALARDEGLFWRDYMGFLAGMPMNLLDDEVWIDAEVTREEIDGRGLLTILVSFDPEVGTDLWRYYFDPRTFELVACRFHREDPAKDGELLIFDGLSEHRGLRIPAKREWYMNADARFLGTDLIELGPIRGQ